MNVEKRLKLLSYICMSVFVIIAIMVIFALL